MFRVARIRIYGSASSFGAPFQVPSGSPLVLSEGNNSLEVYLGQAPDWVLRAHARRAILGEALLRATFRAEANRSALAEALKTASPAVIARNEDRWFVTIVLSHVHPMADIGTDEDLVDFAGRVFAAKLAGPSAETLDLAVRTLRLFLPNVLDDVLVEGLVAYSSVTTDDAIGVPEPRFGAATLSVGAAIARAESIIADQDLHGSLRRVLKSTPVPPESGRADRLSRAVQTDLLADHIGAFGRYELYRELQPELMRAIPTAPLVVMFVDMNGLKTINDAEGHDAGDQAILAFRDAVRAVVKGPLFRTGGDEFVIFVRGPVTDAVATAKELLSAVANKGLSASIGIVTASDACESPKAIITRADKEMYRAKAVSRDAGEPRRSTLAIEGASVETIFT